jgi:DNA-binding MarR family transcriptional regulator
MTTDPFRFENADDSPGFLLWQLTNLWQQAIHAALAPLGLTHVQFVLLASLGWLEKSEEAISQAKLARHAHTDVMMTSQVLRALEAKGLCQRTAHPNDARALRVMLTEEGRRMVEQSVPVVEAADARFFAGLGEQGKQFARMMGQLIAENGEERRR